MVMLCFVLDLRSLSPPVLRDLKQALLQLANYYAICTLRKSNRHCRNQSKPLADRIGICYILKSRTSCSDELKVAYHPSGNFNLRDFHRAVNNLPTDAFSPEFDESGFMYCKDLMLSDVLSNKVLYSWGDQDRDIARNVILISSSLVKILDITTKEALSDAADKCISVDFIFLEQTSSNLGHNTVNFNNFVEQIGYLENCSFRAYAPDWHLLLRLVRTWFQELKDDMEEPLQALLVFKINLIRDLKQISCNLCSSVQQIIDCFDPCQTCRCHGIPLNSSSANQNKKPNTCPETGEDLDPLDLIQNSIKIGEQTILYMPSFLCIQKLRQVSAPIELNVIQRINLGSLSEGLITGSSYFVSPSLYHDSDDNEKSELNIQTFLVVCRFLSSLDQGLVCSSNSNIETAMETSLQCYYILLPSDKGVMLLRRLAGSEEVWPVHDNQINSFIVAQEIEDTVEASLLKMEVRDYDPHQHERGFHQKLNMFVKESLQFGAIALKIKERSSESNSSIQDCSSEVQQTSFSPVIVTMGDESQECYTKVREEKPSPSVTEEWEQLIITEVKMPSPACLSKPSTADQPVTSPSQSNKQLDERTSRILERLEVPRQHKRKAASPANPSGHAADLCAPVKKPLIPYASTPTSSQGLLASQPMKPNFQRHRRKK